MLNKIRRSLEFTPPAFREITIQVSQLNGINLGQGVCMMPTPQVVMEGAIAAVRRGDNLYSAAQGIEPLREALAHKLTTFNKIPCKANNVLITNGATGAFEVICETFLDPGDEVVAFIPFYPHHRNFMVRKGVKIRFIPLRPPNWEYDSAELTAACNAKTKFILVTTPNNPTGKVFSKSELEGIAQLCRSRDLICVTDEVYEYMTYDGHTHLSIASLPDMFERTMTMGSYSKTFAITGWRIGYIAAPSPVIEKLKTISDQIYVCAPTPFQYGVAAGIRELKDDYYENLRSEYIRKRDIMRGALINAGLEPLMPQGAYYMVTDMRKKFPNMSSNEAMDIMIRDAHVGAVPASDFLGPETKGSKEKSTFFRFCFAMPDQMLIKAGESLRCLSN